MPVLYMIMRVYFRIIRKLLSMVIINILILSNK